MKCVTCGHEAEYDFRFCPNCGATTMAQTTDPAPPAATTMPNASAQAAAAPVILTQAGAGSRPAAYVRADYDPTRDGRWRQQAAVSQPGMVQSAGQPSSSGSSQPAAYDQRSFDRRTAASAASAGEEPRPSTTAQIVIASINIIFIGLGISFVLGIIALVFTIMASGETAVSEAWSKLRTAKTLNIIGLVFLAIQLLLIIVLATVGVVMFANIFSETEPTFGGDYPLG